MFIAHSTSTEKKNAYIPELKRRENEVGNALLQMGDEWIALCDERIRRLPDKHRNELYNRVLPVGGAAETLCVGLLAFDGDMPVRIPAGLPLTGYADDKEARYALTEPYTVSPVSLCSLWLTEPERDGYCRLYSREDGTFTETGFTKAVTSPDNFSLLTFMVDNLLLGVSEVKVLCETIPALAAQINAFSWTAALCDGAEGVDEADGAEEAEAYVLTAEIDGAYLRLSTDVPFQIGMYRLKAHCAKSVTLTPGLLYRPSFIKSGECAPDYLIVGGEVLIVEPSSSELSPGEPLFGAPAPGKPAPSEAAASAPAPGKPAPSEAAPSEPVSGEPASGAVIYPFGQPFQPREAFYIACNAAFCGKGGEASIHFSLSFAESQAAYPLLPPQGRDIPKPMDAFADCVTLQYFNGDAFVPFPESACYKTLFTAERPDACITLRIPADMSPVEVHGLTAFWVRLYLVSSEWFDYRPVTYHSPVLTGITITYQSTVAPERIRYETLYEQRDITQAAAEDGVTVFTPRFRGEGGLYMGLTGSVSGGLNLYVSSAEQIQIPVTGPGCALLTTDGETAIPITDGTDGWRRTGVLSLTLPSHPEAVFFLDEPAQLFMRFPLAARAGLADVQDLRLHVCPAVGTGLLPKDTVLTGDHGLSAVVIGEGFLSRQRGEISTVPDARFFLSTQERPTNPRDITLALRKQFPQLDSCRLVYDASRQGVDVYVQLQETASAPFYLFGEQVTQFLVRYGGIMPTVTVKPFMPVFVTVRALCALDGGATCGSGAVGERLRDRLGAYIEDRLLFPPGYLPSAEDLQAFLRDEGATVSLFAVWYQAADASASGGQPEDFPYGIARSGAHLIMVQTEAQMA